jgi:hypothetical protein
MKLSKKQTDNKAVEVAVIMGRNYGMTFIRANNTVAMYKPMKDDPSTVLFELANADPEKLHVMNVYVLLAAFKDMGFSDAYAVFNKGKGYGAFFPKHFSDIADIEDSEIPEFGELQLTVDLDTFGEENATV